MFITFEGPDGSGKSTAIDSLKKYLDSKGIEYVFTREPGSSHSKEAQRIREIILDNSNHLTNMTEAILYAADRRLNLENTIWPAIKAKKIILCDRYLDSTLAYQGAGRGLGIKEMKKLQDVITEKTYPDVTLFFDIKPEIAFKRLDSRNSKDRLELAGAEFHERVYQGYKDIIKMFPKRKFEIIDASKNKEQVFKQVVQVISKYVK